jgi:photosystem II stability/assembly factor-like uncharacterized protein
MPYALAHAGDRLFAGLADGRVFATSDAGETWAQLEASGDRISELHALAIAPA